MSTAFETWKCGKRQYLAVPGDHGVAIIDDTGASYGAWYCVEEFRARQRRSPLADDWAPIGFGSVSVRCVPK